MIKQTLKKILENNIVKTCFGIVGACGLYFSIYLPVTQLAWFNDPDKPLRPFIYGGILITIYIGIAIYQVSQFRNSLGTKGGVVLFGYGDLFLTVFVLFFSAIVYYLLLAIFDIKEYEEAIFSVLAPVNLLLFFWLCYRNAKYNSIWFQPFAIFARFFALFLAIFAVIAFASSRDLKDLIRAGILIYVSARLVGTLTVTQEEIAYLKELRTVNEDMDYFDQMSQKPKNFFA